MTKQLLTIGLLLITSFVFAQKTKPKMVKNFWDFEKRQIQSQGYYYGDQFYGETTMEHGLWRYWDKQGRLKEERNYFKGELHGEVIRYYASGQPLERGYCDHGSQDSIYTSWYENGKLKEEGNYSMNRPVGD